MVIHLKFGQHRFSELQRALPDISQRMLTQTLRKLEREGHSKWAMKARQGIERARKVYDKKKNKGI